MAASMIIISSSKTTHLTPIAPKVQSCDIALPMNPELVKNGDLALLSHSNSDLLDDDDSIPVLKDVVIGGQPPEDDIPIPINDKPLRSGGKRQKKASESFSQSFGCTRCSFTTFDRKKYMGHCRMAHIGTKSFCCPECSARFTRLYYLNRHQQAKHKVVSHPPNPIPKVARLRKCPWPHCTYSTRNSSSLIWHKQSVHFPPPSNNKPFYCTQCQTVYSKRRGLLQHLNRMHNGDKQYFGMKPTGKSKGDPFEHQIDCLDRKQQSLNGGKSIKQPLLSTSSPSHKSASHMISPASNIPSSPALSRRNSCCSTQRSNESKKKNLAYRCDRCEFGADSFKGLYAHRREHKGAQEGSSICHYCARKFPNIDRMLAHVKKTHRPSRRGFPKAIGGKRKCDTPKRSYKCHECDYTATTRSLLTRHELDHVNAEEDEEKSDLESNSPSPSEQEQDEIVKEASFRCSWCPFVTNIESSLEIHRFQSHSDVGASLVSNAIISGLQTAAASGGGGIIGGGRLAANDFIIPKQEPTNWQPLNVLIDSASTADFANSDWSDLSACVAHLQQANTQLLSIAQRRSTQLNDLRSNVLQLFRMLFPEHDALHNLNVQLDSVDEVVRNALHHCLNSYCSNQNDTNTCSSDIS